MTALQADLKPLLQKNLNAAQQQILDNWTASIEVDSNSAEEYLLDDETFKLLVQHFTDVDDDLGKNIGNSESRRWTGLLLLKLTTKTESAKEQFVDLDPRIKRLVGNCLSSVSELLRYIAGQIVQNALLAGQDISDLIGAETLTQYSTCMTQNLSQAPSSQYYTNFTESLGETKDGTSAFSALSFAVEKIIQHNPKAGEILCYVDSENEKDPYLHAFAFPFGSPTVFLDIPVKCISTARFTEDTSNKNRPFAKVQLILNLASLGGSDTGYYRNGQPTDGSLIDFHFLPSGDEYYPNAKGFLEDIKSAMDRVMKSTGINTTSGRRAMPKPDSIKSGNLKKVNKDRLRDESANNEASSGSTQRVSKSKEFIDVSNRSSPNRLGNTYGKNSSATSTRRSRSKATSTISQASTTTAKKSSAASVSTSKITDPVEPKSTKLRDRMKDANGQISVESIIPAAASGKLKSPVRKTTTKKGTSTPKATLKTAAKTGGRGKKPIEPPDEESDDEVDESDVFAIPKEKNTRRPAVETATKRKASPAKKQPQAKPQAKSRSKASGTKTTPKVVELSDEEEEPQASRRSTRASIGKTAKVDYVETSTQQDIEEEAPVVATRSRQKPITKPMESDAVDTSDDENLDVSPRGRQLTRASRGKARSDVNGQDAEEAEEAPPVSKSRPPINSTKTTERTTETARIAPMTESVQQHDVSRALPIAIKQSAVHEDRLEQTMAKPTIVHFNKDGPANQGTRRLSTNSKKPDVGIEDDLISSEQEEERGLAPVFDEIDDDHDAIMTIEDNGQHDTADDADVAEEVQEHHDLTPRSAVTGIPTITVVPGEPMAGNVEDPDAIQDLSNVIQVKHSADLEKDEMQAKKPYDGPVIEESQSQNASHQSHHLFSESAQDFARENAVSTNSEDISIAQQALNLEAGKVHHQEGLSLQPHLSQLHVIGDTIDPRVLDRQYQHNTQHPHKVAHEQVEIHKEINVEIEKHVDAGIQVAHVEEHINVKRHAVEELREEQSKRVKQSEEIEAPSDEENAESPLSSIPAQDEDDEAMVQDLATAAVDEIVEDEPESEDELDQPQVSQPLRNSSQVSFRVDANGSPQPVATQPHITQPTQIIDLPLYTIPETRSEKAHSKDSERARDKREKTVTFVTNEKSEAPTKDAAVPRANILAKEAVAQDGSEDFSPVVGATDPLRRVEQAEVTIISSSPDRTAQQSDQDVSKSVPPAVPHPKKMSRSADHEQTQNLSAAPSPVADTRQSAAQKQKLLEVQEQVLKPANTAKTTNVAQAKKSKSDTVQQSNLPQVVIKPITPLVDEDSFVPRASQMPPRIAPVQSITSRPIQSVTSKPVQSTTARPAQMQQSPASLAPAQKANDEFLKPTPVSSKAKKSAALARDPAKEVAPIPKKVQTQRDAARVPNHNNNPRKSTTTAAKAQVLPHVSTPRNGGPVQKKVIARVLPSAQVQPVDKVASNSKATSGTAKSTAEDADYSRATNVAAFALKTALVNPGTQAGIKQAVLIAPLNQPGEAHDTKDPGQQTRELAEALYITVQSLRLVPKKQETKIVNLILRRCARDLVLNMLDDEDKLREAVKDAVRVEEEQVRKRNTTLAAGIGQSTEPQPVLPVSSFQQKLLEAGQPSINATIPPKIRSIIDWDDDEPTLVQGMDMDDVSSLPQSLEKPRRAQRQIHSSGTKHPGFDYDDALSEDEEMTMSSPFTSSDRDDHDSMSDTLVEDTQSTVALRPPHEQGVIDAVNKTTQAYCSQLFSHGERVVDLCLAYEHGGLAQIDLLERCRQQEADAVKQQLVESRKKLAAGLKTIQLNLTKQAEDVEEVGKWFEVGQAAWDKKNKEMGQGLKRLQTLC